MSVERSSSAVRNLRSLFENKASENSPDTRGRSPGLLSRPENENISPLPPRSRIRASFVAVEPRFTMASAAEENTAVPTDVDVDVDVKQTTTSELHRESSKGLRRASFSDNKDGVAAGALRETISTEQARRDEDSSVGETIPESAIESAAPTPMVEVDQQLGAPKVDKPASNPDKPVTGAEEEPATMKPADPTSEEAVSGGKALAPGAEDLRKPEAKKASKKPASTRPTANGKVSSITTKDTPKPSSSSIKSPTSQPKTPLSPTAPSSASTVTSPNQTAQPGKKPGRASLTAPTAASVARAAAADKAAAAANKQLAPKPKPREVTKPIDSRLTAPTAASRAKYEQAPTAPAIPKPSTTATRPKTATTRPTPRQSLARPESRGSQTSTRRPAGPVDSSFLERMTRPTAASSSKTHKIQEKVEVKSPSRSSKQIPHRPKTNGHPKGVGTASKGAVEEPVGDTTAIEEPSILPEEEAEQPPIEDESVQDVAEGAPVEAAPKAEKETVETDALPAAEAQLPEKAVGAVNDVPHTNGHTNGDSNGHKEEVEAAPAVDNASTPATVDATLS